MGSVVPWFEPEISLQAQVLSTSEYPSSEAVYVLGVSTWMAELGPWGEPRKVAVIPSSSLCSLHLAHTTQQTSTCVPCTMHCRLSCASLCEGL